MIWFLWVAIVRRGSNGRNSQGGWNAVQATVAELAGARAKAFDVDLIFVPF
jgi:hypothetical protein